MSGTLSVLHRSETDCTDTVLSYAEIKALAIGNPLLRQRVEIANSLERTKMHQRRRKKELLQFEEILYQLPKQVEKRQQLIVNTKKDRMYYEKHKEVITREERTAFGEELILALTQNVMKDKERIFCEYQGAEVVLPKVEVTTVASRDVVQQVIFTGNVEAEAVNNIAPQQPRRIKEIRFDVGDHVRKGETLVSLENSALVQSKAQMDNAKIEYDRTDELYKIGGASKSEWDARRLQYEVAKATYENLLENTTLVAPISGIVTARNYDNGDMAGGLPVLVIEQIRPVKIMINISENLFARVRKGMKVDVNFEAYGDEVFAGSISRIYPTINNATRTFAAEVTIPNNDERVRPGMFARVTLPYGKQNRVVTPDRSVNKLMGSGDRYVYVLEADGTVRYSKVELGRRLGSEWEILSGLESGETVVVKGATALTNGCKVEVVNK